MKIAILGAGISGLSVAWYLKKKYGKQIDLMLYETNDRVGGWIRSFNHVGFHFEAGPRGFRPAGKGAITLQLVDELGLTSELIAANPNSRKRYILLNGTLHYFSPWYLIRSGVVPGVFHDLCTPATDAEDETIDQFFRRRFNRKLAINVIDPLTQGIFAGNPQELSMRSCFPFLWNAEQEYGSVIKGMWRAQKKREGSRQPSLYSFKKGMEMLPKSLIRQLDCTLCLKHEITDVTQLSSDRVISTLPGYALSKLLRLPDFMEYATLTLVYLGWRGAALKQGGYGFLIPSFEKGKILGMTWDSEMFPQHNVGPQTRITTMIHGAVSEEEGYGRALEALSSYLDLRDKPDAMCVSYAIQAIPQYKLFHHKAIARLKEQLPPHFYALGTGFEGAALNDLIGSAQKFVNALSF